MIYLISASPILLCIFLLVIIRMRIPYVAAHVFAYTAVLALAKWPITIQNVGAAVGKGLLLTLDISVILLGAIVFLNYLKKAGLFSRIEALLSSLTPDRRVQAILLAWLFGSFIEGTSGFGTPALIVAPLLVGIGFPSLLAILVSLTANSTAVAFGAVGTPLRIGFAGLEIVGVSEKAALINLITGNLVPFLILAFVVWPTSQRRIQAFLECAPFAIFSGLVFLIPYYLCSFVGFEFPSLVGAAIGMLSAIAAIRLRVLVPKSTFRFSSDKVPSPSDAPQSSFVALSPYLLLVAILVGGKLLLSDLKISIELGKNLSHSILLFNPGFAFLTAVILINIRKRLHLRELFRLTISSSSLIGKTSVSIFCVAATTYVMVSTGKGSSPGMLETIAEPLTTPALPFFSVFVGALGAFLAGSATVSNLLFGPIQVQAADALGFSVPWILALQLVGAGVGNMIALPNLVAVEAAVGVRDQEASLLRRLALPCFLYLVLAGTLGHFLVA